MLHFVQINMVNAALGAKVADFRRAHGWSQAQLAERFGDALGHQVDPTTITRLEQGKRPLPVHELVALSQVLTVEPSVFFKFINPLEDAIAALRFETAGRQARAAVAAAEATEAQGVLEALEALLRYRDTGTSEDLAAGVQFLWAETPQFQRRRDWRELLLAAGVPPEAIEASDAEIPTGPDFDPDGDPSRYVKRLIANIGRATRARGGRKHRG